MTKTDDELKNALMEFDGRALTVLSEINLRFSDRVDFLDSLVELSGKAENHISNGATWLIKFHLDSGGQLSGQQRSRLLSELKKVQDWAAQLHVCQSVQYLAIPKKSASALIGWLRPLLTHQRPFLRAWSLDALVRVSKQHPKFSEFAQAAHKKAQEDPAASVRARARNLSI